MRHFWQWLCGYVCICVKGRQVNRFLNLCSRNGIHLWRISYDIEQSIRASLRLRDFYDLKPYLRKTKTKMRILSKKGFPFWCHRHPKLKWFLCICFLGLCLGIYSLNFVWNIEVKGNSIVSTEEIIESLQNNSIDTGLKKDDIDCSGIERLLREKFHQIGWVSVYFDHTSLCVEIKESLYDTVDDAGSCDGKMYHLIANKDARITSIVTRAGTAVVGEGATVKRGEILVLGQSEILDDNGAIKEILSLKADALVYGEVTYDIIIPISEMEIVSLKIAQNRRESDLLALGFRKLNYFLEKLEANEVTILDIDAFLDRNEKDICFRAKIYAREQIGINIPVEEVWENEFE